MRAYTQGGWAHRQRASYHNTFDPDKLIKFFLCSRRDSNRGHGMMVCIAFAYLNANTDVIENVALSSFSAAPDKKQQLHRIRAAKA